MLAPKVKYVVKPEKDTYITIANFFPNDGVAGNIFQQYIANNFGLDINYFKGKNFNEKVEYVESKLSAVYKNTYTLMVEKVGAFQQAWNELEPRIISEFERIFKVKFDSDYKVCFGFVNINPVCPRYLKDWAFDINFAKSNNAALATSIHEITHFIWFEKWKEVFPNWKPKDFEYPSVSWLLSEIAIDSIFYHSWFKELIGEISAYHYFYDAEIEHNNLIKTFRNLFVNSSIEDFMKKGLSLLERNPEAVKSLIR